ncbi:carboxymuconolactone decarboxylase family protein [uncultured Aliiroseovarius sp.]|uniref:carboxymuconolactone decarboxylase family protein n=1 Tax=uncultured Aliiroseovarius sp. TaxID=1658783 RepID=UPI00262EA9AC|nr:carboxymuconolactone decarboxylase family protein [uncultured Aliiroseovarius sp.]
MVNKLKPKIEPFTENLARIMQRYPRIDGYLLNLFRVFANSERFAEKAVPNLLDKDSPLSLRHREIAILRVTANRRCEYEWGIHVSLFAKAAKLTRQEVEDTCSTVPNPDLWPERELNLMAVIDELLRSGSPSKEARTTFAEIWTAEQQLEILALCGTYSTISFVANLSGLRNEPFAACFPVN